MSEALLFGNEPAPAEELSQEDLQELLDNIEMLDENERTELLQIAATLEQREFANACRSDLIEFAKAMQPDYNVGAHHRHLAKLLMAIEKGEKDRITVSIAPRHGKSQMTSIFYSAWYLGKNPTHQVILASHTGDLAVDFGRKVRNLIASDEYQAIFPGVQLAADSKSAGRWSTHAGGGFFACGVGASIAGRGADMLIIDDPISEQALLSGDFEQLDKVYEWFRSGARTRLMKGGRIAVVACMTGDTRVLMADGSEKILANVRAGDVVMSYDGKNVTPKKVLNWANQGPDRVYSIRLNNGNLIKANARHPFLVVRDGVESWVRVRDMLRGDAVVSLKGASEPSQRKAPQASASHVEIEKATDAELQERPKSNVSHPNQKSALLKGAPHLHGRTAPAVSVKTAYPETTTTGKTPMPLTAGPITGASGGVKRAAPKVAKNLPEQVDFANGTIISNIGQAVEAVSLLIREETLTLNTVMGFLSKSTIGCWLSREESALFVESLPTRQMYPTHGTGGSQSTTATTAGEFGRCYATSATSWSEMEQTRTVCAEESNIYELTPVKIVSIEPDGVENVFDIEVEDTENFIANGVVSHNTRWHKTDLIGRLIRDGALNELADQYEVVEFPAILNEHTPEEKALWPEFFPLEALHRTRNSMPPYQWNAQYQQNPTGDTSSIVKREWWRVWEKDEPPECDYILMALDAAAELNNRADFTSITTWGVFFNEEEDVNQLILLNSVHERMEFPELKIKALQQYKFWEPDSYLVEKKSSGVALYQELRRMGVPVTDFTPHRGTKNDPNTKFARLNAVADIIKEGMVWIPATQWAADLAEEVAEFPTGDHDDRVDTTIMVLTRFRQGGFLTLPTDYEDKPNYKRRRGGYY